MSSVGPGLILERCRVANVIVRDTYAIQGNLNSTY